MEPLGKFHIVDFSIIVDVSAHHEIIDFFNRVHLLRFHSSMKFFRGDPTILVTIELLEGLTCGQVLQLQEHIEEFQDQLHTQLRFDQSIDHLFTDRAV